MGMSSAQHGWQVFMELPFAKIIGKQWPPRKGCFLLLGSYCSLAYSVFASFRMGMSGSASFQRVRKSS
jgi:hypothetical protein